jgi:hypothetical protein
VGNLVFRASHLISTPEKEEEEGEEETVTILTNTYSEFQTENEKQNAL